MTARPRFDGSTSCQTVPPIVFARHETFVAGSDNAAPYLAVSLTYYNEPESALQATFDSLLAAMTPLARIAPNAVLADVYLLVDDGPGLPEPVTTFIAGSGFARPEFASRPDCVDRGVQIAQFRLHRAGADPAVPGDGPPAAIRLNICLKDRNRGKLDSHRWFFGCLLEGRLPDFVVQVDAGTVIEPSSLERMTAVLVSSPDIAAIVPRIETDPGTGDDSLALWQAADFVLGNELDRTTQSLLGYIDVTPGQFSMYRRASLESRLADGRTRVLDAYLNDTVATSLLQRNRSQTEDRLLVYHLATSGGASARSAYLPQARAVTDHCDSLMELLRQRRRWNNGELASTLHGLGAFAGAARRGDASALRRLNVAASLCLQAAQRAFEYLRPALDGVAVLALAAFILARDPGSVFGMLLAALYALDFLGVLWLSGSLARRQGSDAQKQGRLAILTGLAAVKQFGHMLALVHVVLQLMLNGKGGAGAGLLALLGLFLASGGGRLAAAWKYFASRDLGGSSLPAAMRVWLIDGEIKKLIVLYSNFRIDDASWGTKGKTASGRAAGSSGGPADRSRLAWLSVWAFSNGLAICIAIIAAAARPGLLAVAFGVAALARLAMHAATTVLISRPGGAVPNHRAPAAAEPLAR